MAAVIGGFRIRLELVCSMWVYTLLSQVSKVEQFRARKS